MSGWTQRSWGDERIEALRKLAQKGASASQIAAALSAQEGREVSRNAVIGAMHRHKISSQAASGRGARPPAKISERKRTVSLAVAKSSAGESPSVAVRAACKGAEVSPVSWTPPPPPAATPLKLDPLPDTGGVTFLELDALFTMCRRIIGPVRGFETRFCGARTASGTSWCPTCTTRLKVAAPKPQPRPGKRSHGGLNFQKVMG